MTHFAQPPQVGQTVETWFSDRPDGRSTILEVTPYRGRYPELFTHVVRCTAPRTYRGWMELCADTPRQR